MTTKSRLEKLEKRTRKGGILHVFVHHEGGPTECLEAFKARYPDDQNRVIFHVIHDDAVFKDDRIPLAGSSLGL